MVQKTNSYSCSLNLPKSNINIRSDHKKLELNLINKWKENGLYKKINEKDSYISEFELHDGPPYANGNIHPGHVLNKILKDIILKSKRLSGFYSPYKPGWDCHGLPIEIKVSEKIGSKNKKEFKKECSNYATSQLEIQKEQFQRLGILADWDNHYRTDNNLVASRALIFLSKLFEKGLIIKGKIPIFWCLHCKSSLSDYEVEYKNTISKSAFVKFIIINSPYIVKKFPNIPLQSISVLIWTTTIWTLPSNKAVAIHPDFEYLFIGYIDDSTNKKEFIIVVEELVEKIISLKGIKNYNIEGKILGSDLQDSIVCHPFLPKSIPVIFNNEIKGDSGTGIVHIAPAHGVEDYLLGQKYGLDCDTSVDEDGLFNDPNSILHGVDIEESINLIIDILIRANTLFYLEDFEHQYPFCWRHGTQVIYRLTPQWFIPLDKVMQDGKTIREKAFESVDNTKWLPDWGLKRIKQGIINRPNWCISRQRYWGLPLTLFVDKNTGEAHQNSAEFILKIADMVKEKGTVVWDDLDINLFLGEDSDNYEKEKCVLDVWFDSGVTHFSTREDDRVTSPATVYIEGSDQFRGWFMSSLVTSISVFEQSPYQKVISHGFVVDKDGRKMSKSLGNVVDVDDLLEKYGAESLRSWVASSDYQSEVSISNDIIERSNLRIKKIRNTLRYIVANLYDFNVDKSITWDNMVAIDQYVIHDLEKRQKFIIDFYNKYQFQKAYDSIFNYCNDFLSSTYLEILKDRLYVENENSISRRSAQVALYHLANSIVRWISPILTFTAEEFWPHVKSLDDNNCVDSVFLSRWWNLNLFSDKTLKIQNFNWNKLFSLRDLVLSHLEKARVDNLLKNNLESSITIIVKQKNDFDLFYCHLDELHYLLNVSETMLKLENSIDVDFVINIESSKNKKCSRCWLKRIEIEDNDLCDRCTHCIKKEDDNGTRNRRWF